MQFNDQLLHGTPYFKYNHILLMNISSTSLEIHRIVSNTYHDVRRDSLISNGISNEIYANSPNTSIFSIFLQLFSLFDQCAMYCNNQLGNIISRKKASYFGKKAKETALGIANAVHADQRLVFLAAHGFYERDGDAIESEWHILLTQFRHRVIYHQGVFFQSDLKSINLFLLKSGYRKSERDNYNYRFGTTPNITRSYDFISFLLFACENLVSLVSLYERYL